jgi:SAM-dependent methyltransferase
MEYWDPYQERSFAYDTFPSGARVLDIGFGDGMQMEAVRAAGAQVVGVEYSPELVEKARARGFDVQQAPAERLPFPDASFDGVICKVVVPYTDEAFAIREWGRVMKAGATALVSYHGAGYYLRYLLEPEHWKERVYGARALANTWVYRWLGRRLPGFVGDTIYQAERRLQRHYACAGLAVESRTLGATYRGYPVFIHHRLRRRDDDQASR